MVIFATKTMVPMAVKKVFVIEKKVKRSKAAFE